MSLTAAIAPLMELVQNELVQDKVGEAAKQIFTNGSITVNTLGLLAAGLLGLLGLVFLLPLLFPPAADTGSSGYGAPAAEYGAPAAEYGAPASGYGYRSDEGVEEYRSLLTNLLDSADPQFSLTKRMQQVAGPAIQTLGDAAAKLIQ